MTPCGSFRGQAGPLPVAALLLLVMVVAGPLAAQDPPPPVNAGTPSGPTLRAPPVVDSFTFAIFGDRTTGERAGLQVLEEAVQMANRLGPTFVLTVGDMVQGYNAEPKWLQQMREYREVVSHLEMPWYPVVGNHDVYARPRVPGGNTRLYKQHFGPLYYSFDHRWAHFICLFSDEALSFSQPARDQNLGPEQMEWLRRDLAATEARQIFVFLHHPRWIYPGCNWPEVHALLAADGRTAAVFAGHVHEYRDDGVRDGIHYYTLAVTGAAHTDLAPVASFDHIDLVQVRSDSFRVAVLPVGSVWAADVVLGSEVDDLHRLQREAWWKASGPAWQDLAAPACSTVEVELSNPTGRPVVMAAELEVPGGWQVNPLEARMELPPGETARAAFRLQAPPVDVAAPPSVTARVQATYRLGRGAELDVSRAGPVPVQVTGMLAPAEGVEAEDQVLVLDGHSALRVDLTGLAEDLESFTLECWVQGSEPAARAGLVTRTESSGFGLFWSDPGAGHPEPVGYVHLKPIGRYVAAGGARWDWSQWTHLALVYDGQALVLFVDGQPAARSRARGRVTPGAFPLLVGADPGRHGKATSHFTGRIDEVRLSDQARYRESFTPARRHQADEHTLLLLHLDTVAGGLHPDDSGRGRHGWPVGRPVLEPASGSR